MPTEILVKDLRHAFEEARDLDGSMAERLNVFADATRQLHPSTAAIVDRLVTRLKEHKAGEESPEAWRLNACIYPSRRGRSAGEFEGSAGAWTGRSHISSRPLVPVLPD